MIFNHFHSITANKKNQLSIATSFVLLFNQFNLLRFFNLYNNKPTNKEFKK